MNWKIAGIVVVAGLSLIGIGGGIYAAVKIFHMALEAPAQAQCSSKNADTSISGCTAILSSGKADKGQQEFAHFQRATAYARKGAFDSAIADDTEVIRINPRQYMAWNQRGALFEQKGELDPAIADFTQAIQLAPEMSAARFNRSEAYSKKGDYAAAIDDLSAVVQREPKNSVAWNNRCYFRAIAGHLDAALADCNQSLKLVPGVGNTLDSRGFTYLRMKKYSLAIADYDAAVSAGGKRAPWLYGRGLAKRALHDEAGAKIDIEEAMKLDAKIAATFRSYGVS
ncbi:MAG TPA: tetratricopeptide repeat protein [Acidobacteriaceae bacterium]